MTTSNGNPVDDNQNTMSAGEYGPLLMQDFHYLDKMAHFDRERIPERVVHAKGAGAFGTFKVTQDVTKYCKAKFLSEIGKETPVAIRFSTVGGEKGSADTERDPRGFAIKFYTEEGNWDMVGNNTPVFFIRDPSKFPDFIHTQKRNPQTNLKDADMFWDFLSQTPESAHQVTILFSDKGTPFGYRKMHGYGSHTFRWVNDKEEVHYVKFHFKAPEVKNLSEQEAAKLRGENPDFATQDLFNAIKDGDFPTWDFKIQAMPEKDAENYEWNIFDVTKVWPHKDYPLIDVGQVTLNKNPDNYFAQVEQIAFSPSHMVPGIEPSADKMLQGRLFSYPDTQRHRLGGNYDQIPVNCPYRTKVYNGIRDGPMVVNGNQGSDPNFEPCSYKKVEMSQKAIYSKNRVQGLAARCPVKHPNSDFTQPGNLYRHVLDAEGKTNLVNNLVGHMKGVSRREIQVRQCKIFYKCDIEYGTRVAEGLGIKVEEIKE